MYFKRKVIWSKVIKTENYFGVRVIFTILFGRRRCQILAGLGRWPVMAIVRTASGQTKLSKESFPDIKCNWWKCTGQLGNLVCLSLMFCSTIVSSMAAASFLKNYTWQPGNKNFISSRKIIGGFSDIINKISSWRLCREPWK